MDFTADEYARRDADRIREVLAGPPVTWVFLGDSITQGVAHTHGWRSYVELFTERVRGELGRVGDAVVNSGVSGSTSEDLLSEFHWRAGRFAPDVILAMFGTNDMLEGEDGIRAYRYRLDQIVQRGRDVGATVLLQTPPPVLDEGPRSPELMAKYADALREVASNLGVLVVDHARAWHTVALSEGGDAAPAGWLDDHVHPGPTGHRAMAATLLDALGVNDPVGSVGDLGTGTELRTPV